MWPILVHLGPLTLKTYGLMVALAFLVGGGILKKGFVARDLAPELADRIVWISLISAIAGSRILYILSNPVPWTEFFLIWQGGLSFLGGLLGAFAACLIYLKKKGVPWLKVADATALVLPVGHAIGRMGCLAAGCCWGRPAKSFPGITFTNPECVLPSELLGIRLHPTQLYEAAGLIVIYFIVKKLEWRFPGRLLGIYVLLYGFLRFSLEFFRADSFVEPGLGPLTFTQAVLLFGLAPPALAWIFWAKPLRRA